MFQMVALVACLHHSFKNRKIFHYSMTDVCDDKPCTKRAKATWDAFAGKITDITESCPHVRHIITMFGTLLVNIVNEGDSVVAGMRNTAYDFIRGEACKRLFSANKKLEEEDSLCVLLGDETPPPMASADFIKSLKGNCLHVQTFWKILKSLLPTAYGQNRDLVVLIETSMQCTKLLNREKSSTLANNDQWLNSHVKKTPLFAPEMGTQVNNTLAGDVALNEYMKMQNYSADEMAMILQRTYLPNPSESGEVFIDLDNYQPSFATDDNIPPDNCGDQTLRESDSMMTQDENSDSGSVSMITQYDSSSAAERKSNTMSDIDEEPPSEAGNNNNNTTVFSLLQKSKICTYFVYHKC